ncbi:MAG: hypothetical protein SXV54_02380 [Chloroflexota bacterium]|nr:hypothetical protein [Chloroflexota bacterium]
MRRTLIYVGLVVFALLVLTSISATVAAPENNPLLQVPDESEPNDDFLSADNVSSPGSITGVITRSTLTGNTDYFVFDTQIGREYRARLNIYTAGDFRLQMNLFNGDQGYRDTSSSSSSYTSMEWTANQASHYIQIEALSPGTTTLQTASYQLSIDEFAATPTATSTALPGADDYEPNDSMGAAYPFPIATSVSATDANFVPSGTDQDWFSFYVKSGRLYRASTSNLSGVDTFVEIFNRDSNRVAYDNDGGGGFASRAEWTASYDGYYYIKVTNQVGISGSSDTYDLTVAEISVAATATSAPASSNPNADRCDKTELGNHDFDHACVISANVTEEFNFVPPPYGGSDNDFFRIWVKPGLLFECSTSNLSAGVDPNMIVYNHNRDAIGGNDDVEQGNFNSYFAYYSTYEGWMYVLIGYGDRTPPNLSDSSYTLRCDMEVPGQPTATGTHESTRTPQPTATTGARTPTSTPASSPATPTPSESLTVRSLTTPTPVPATTPAPRFIPIRLLVYYDGNDDRQPGAGEGIAGISAQAYEVVTNQLLAQDFTDEQGNLEFTVASSGPVRVRVPFFGFSQLVAGEGASIYLRVPPQPLSGGIP